MKRRLLSMAFLAFVVVVGSAQLLTHAAKPGGGGSCSQCGGTTPACCMGCNGQFAFCARSYAFCPECPAP